MQNLPDSDKAQTHPRYKPCLTLSDNKVPYVIWFEDALHYHGVPTAVFDLYLLVLDIEIAADCLIKAGWALDESPHRIGMADVTTPQVSLLAEHNKSITVDENPFLKPTRTVLLPASDWKFPLVADPPLERVQQLPFPPLSGLLDALIESWLDGPTGNEKSLHHLAVQLGYLYGHAPALKEKSFAEQMKYEHRQFHFDVLAGMELGTVPFRKHQRSIRDALLQGRYEFQECSASRDKEDLFDNWSKIRLPDAVHADVHADDSEEPCDLK
ncbi:hypothetical protein BJX99DRAFT_69097 [Aspergillus californicus]